MIHTLKKIVRILVIHKNDHWKMVRKNILDK
jgi:hypothetical protein